MYLAGKANLELTKAQIELFDQINKFNLEIRYPEDLNSFYKKVNKKYARKYLDESKELWKWLQSLLEK